MVPLSYQLPFQRLYSAVCRDSTRVNSAVASLQSSYYQFKYHCSTEILFAFSALTLLVGARNASILKEFRSSSPEIFPVIQEPA